MCSMHVLIGSSVPGTEKRDVHPHSPDEETEALRGKIRKEDESERLSDEDKRQVEPGRQSLRGIWVRVQCPEKDQEEHNPSPHPRPRGDLSHQLLQHLASGLQEQMTADFWRGLPNSPLDIKFCPHFKESLLTHHHGSLDNPPPRFQCQCEYFQPLSSLDLP